MTVTHDETLGDSKSQIKNSPLKFGSICSEGGFMKQEYRWWKKTAVSVLSVIVFFVLLGQSITAQTTNPQPQSNEVKQQTADAQQQTPDVQQLKDRVKQLEQTVEELKKQINIVEVSQKQSVPLSTLPNAQVIPAVLDKTPTADPSKPPPAPQASSGESTFEIYGFAMLDFGYQFKQNHPDWYDVIRVTKLPSFKNEFAPDGHTYMGVRQSRLGVKSSTPTRLGELKTIFEFELFGTGVDAGQTTFRLRHAYGELGQFGAGQYWSPFMDIDVFPNSIEYWGPTGMPLFRNVQARWMPIKGRSFVTLALEKPGASADQGQFADRIELKGVKPQFRFPDFSWEGRYGRDWGYVELAGIFRHMKWVDTNTTDKVDLSGSALGWGLNLSSNLKVGDRTTLKLEGTYGAGIQNYMNDSPVDVGIQINSGDPTRPIVGKALPIFGMTSFVDHNWNKKWSSSVGYSFQNIENTSGQNANAFHRGYYALGNLLYYPVPNVMIGGEFQWGKRANWRDGFTADDYRIQIAFKYNFSKAFKF